MCNSDSLDIQTYEFAVNKDNCRLDVYISEVLPQISRSRIKKLSEEKLITVRGIVAEKAGMTVRMGDIIKICVPPAKELNIGAKNIPIDIIYEDDSMAVVNKPQGRVVHPAPGSYDDTLVNALLYKLDSLSGINGVIRPGIVHRLDKDTSGLLVIAKNDAAHKNLQEQIATKSAVRKYLALQEGALSKDSGVIDNFLNRSSKDGKKYTVAPNGRRAITLYHVVKRYCGYTLTEFELKTGRTHQIRVHAKHMGHSIVGDCTYCTPDKKFGLKGQLLHAYKLELNHPISGERMVF